MSILMKWVAFFRSRWMLRIELPLVLVAAWWRGLEDGRCVRFSVVLCAVYTRNTRMTIESDHHPPPVHEFNAFERSVD